MFYILIHLFVQLQSRNFSSILNIFKYIHNFDIQNIAKVLKLWIANKPENRISDVNSIEAIANKEIFGDKHFSENKNSRKQVALIESENIDKYNLNSNTKIPYLDFRRNIVTKGIKLNDLLNKQITIGNIKLLGKDLCRPCRHLQELLGYNNIVKEFLLKGGLRCEIINSGTIYLNDEIKIWIEIKKVVKIP
mgnify:CR=1 FL=1